MRTNNKQDKIEKYGSNNKGMTKPLTSKALHKQLKITLAKT